MAFTDHSHLFGSVHEDGINKVVRHLMRQRPSLFNYATPIFHTHPELFCEDIVAAKSVTDAGNPLFTEQAPLTIPGSPIPIGLNFCVQLTHAEIDFHPENVVDLPPELGKLPPQSLAVRARACAGLDCPADDVIDQIIPAIEAELLKEKELVFQPDDKEDDGRPDDRGHSSGRGRGSRVTTYPTHKRPPYVVEVPGEDVFTPPPGKMMCFCLELFAIGHFEWGTVFGSDQQWLKPRLDRLEIVDIQPTPMEDAIECYVSTVLRLGVLPRVIVPMEKMILDITAMMKKHGVEIGQQVTLSPAAVPGDVPNNPAIEEDLLKAFVNLTVTEGGA